MNISRISRIALLSVVFAAPVFAEDSVTPPTGNQQQQEDKAAAEKAAKEKAEKDAADAKAKAEAEAKAKEADKNTKAPEAGDKSKEADKSKEGDKAKETEASFFAKAKDLAYAPFGFMLVTAPDKIADFTYLNAGLVKLTEYSMFSKDGFFHTNAKNGKLGRGVVLAATAAAIAAVVYSKLMAESADMDSEDDQDFFEMNEATDTNNQ